MRQDVEVTFRKVRPGGVIAGDDFFWKKDGKVHGLLVESDHPLGAADLPPEAHPFCVGEAPPGGTV